MGLVGIGPTPTQENGDLGWLKAQECIAEVGYGCTGMSSLEVEIQENTALVGGYNAENW